MDTMTTPVLVIGAGPVGLFSVFMCGMMRMRCCLIDGLPFVGGQCQALYPEKPIYDIPGFPSITGQQLIRRLKKQISPFDPTILLTERAEILSHQETGFIVSTDKGRPIHAKVILICAGGGSFVPKRPPLTNIEQFEGRSVHYHVGKKSLFSGKSVVVAGGGDSAVDWALDLCKEGAHVTMVHRRLQFRASEASLEALRSYIDDQKIHLYAPFQLEGLEGVNGQLSHVLIKNFEGQIVSLSADALLPFFGLSYQLGSLGTWGLTLEKDRIVIDPTTGQTSQPGIYALGDVATYPHKLKLIATGFSEAAQAAHHARHIVFPGKLFGFTHSTTLGIQKFSDSMT